METQVSYSHANGNGAIGQATRSQSRSEHHRTVEPLVDVLESADSILIVADLPGVSIESVDLRVENDTLTLEGRRTTPEPASMPALSREYDEIDFARSFRIPAGIDVGAISAEAKNGTLVVKLPKTSVHKSRKIDVRSS